MPPATTAGRHLSTCRQNPPSSNGTRRAVFVESRRGSDLRQRHQPRAGAAVLTDSCARLFAACPALGPGRRPTALAIGPLSPPERVRSIIDGVKGAGGFWWMASAGGRTRSSKASRSPKRPTFFLQVERGVIPVAKRGAPYSPRSRLGPHFCRPRARFSPQPSPCHLEIMGCPNYPDEQQRELLPSPSG